MRHISIFIAVILLFVLLFIPSIESLTETLHPTAAGNWSQWQGTTWSGLTDNSNTTNIGNNTLWRNATYNFGDHTGNISDAINNITVYGICQRSGSSTSVAFKFKGRGGIFNNSAAKSLSTGAWTVVSNAWLTDPNGGTWTPTSINNMEIGVTLSASSNYVNCSELWAVVDYNLDTFPRWSNPTINETTVQSNQYVNFSANWTDDTNMSSFVFAINQTGNWVNSSVIPFTGTTASSSNVTQITAAAGTNVSWYFQANDSLNQGNKTSINSFVVNTCLYSGSGNWALKCSDKCVFTNTQTIANNNNITITGSGVLNFSSGGKWSFTGTSQYITIASGCTLNINSGGGWDY